MVDLIRCPKCEVIYVPGEAEFCPKCGTKLPDPLEVKRQLARIEDAPRPYAALRFISAMIIVGGWAYLIIGLIISLFLFTVANATFQLGFGDGVPAVIRTLPSYVPLAAGLLNTLVGLIIIGAGQVYAVILDIRDDMHTTMQYVRYGLKKTQGS